MCIEREKLISDSSFFQLDVTPRPVFEQILEMAILRITEEKSLSKVSDLKRVPSLSIHPNPDLGRGHGPFDSFVSSLKSDRSGKEIYGEEEMTTRNSIMLHKRLFRSCSCKWGFGRHRSTDESKRSIDPDGYVLWLANDGINFAGEDVDHIYILHSDVSFIVNRGLRVDGHVL